MSCEDSHYLIMNVSCKVELENEHIEAVWQSTKCIQHIAAVICNTSFTRKVKEAFLSIRKKGFTYLHCYLRPALGPNPTFGKH